jgi:hypothetical protein
MSRHTVPTAERITKVHALTIFHVSQRCHGNFTAEASARGGGEFHNVIARATQVLQHQAHSGSGGLRMPGRPDCHHTRREAAMPLRKGSVRVVMMQRDEGPMLARWLAHHGGLFGFDCITILDNGSKDPRTIALLREAEAFGARINWDLKSRKHFHNKGLHVRNVIVDWDNTRDYDFALPMDCDEILAVFTDHGLTTNHNAIRVEMERLKPFSNALRLDLSLFNVPGRSGWFAPHLKFYKGFLPARSIDSIDEGFHQPVSRLGRDHTNTHFTYLHWHNRPFKEAVAAAKTKLRGDVDVNDAAALRRHAAIPGARGVHLVDLVLMTEQDYHRRYDNDVQIFVAPNGEANLLRVGDTVTIWDAKRYLALNPDVRRYGFPCLHHFLRHGVAEKRRLA